MRQTDGNPMVRKHGADPQRRLCAECLLCSSRATVPRGDMAPHRYRVCLEAPSRRDKRSGRVMFMRWYPTWGACTRFQERP